MSPFCDPVWLHDLASGQTAYRDDYCHHCEQAVGETVAAHALALLEAPVFGGAPGAKPTYCSPGQRTEAVPPGPPIVLAVYGDGKHKPALLDALSLQIAARGRAVHRPTAEIRSSATEEINKLLAQHPGSQVLSVQVQRDLSVHLNLFDSRTQQETAKILKCTDCGDKDVLISRVQPEVAQLLERCLAQSCAAPAARPGGAEAPPDACEPWPPLDCEDGKQLATTAPSQIVYQGLPPKTRNTLQALAWGGVAATAATGVVLYLASGGTEYAARPRVNLPNYLDVAAIASLSISGALVGVAIPTTVLLRRSSSPANQSVASSLLKCPK